MVVRRHEHAIVRRDPFDHLVVMRSKSLAEAAVRLNMAPISLARWWERKARMDAMREPRRAQP